MRAPRSDTHARREPTQVLAGRPGGTLWAQCVGLLSAAFFTLPVVAGSDPLEVDADMEYDPTDPAAGFRHGMEPAIQRILERARRDSPVYWTHVHRYMPSESPWCEAAADDPAVSQPVKSGFAATSAHGADFEPDTLAQPTLAQVYMLSGAHAACLLPSTEH